MSKIYNKDIDKLKGLGIFLMVVGHSGSYFSSFIYLFHMPLFYFLSGYTFKESNADNIKKFIKRRLKSLYIPFIRFGLLFIILHNIFVKINFYDVSLFYDKLTFRTNLFKNFIFISTEQLIGPFWFLTSIFITNIIYVTIVRLFRNKNIKYINATIALLFILNITFFSNNIKFNISILNYYFLMFRISCSGIIFFHIGNLCKKYSLSDKICTNLVYFIVGIVYLYINTKYGNISMGSNQYGSSPTFFIVNALIGIYLSYCVVKFISIRYINNILIFLGKNTITILALHIISFKLVNYLQIKIYKYPIEYLSAFPYIDGSNGWWILYSFVGIIIPALLILLKYSILKLFNKSIIHIKCSIHRLNND